MVVNKEFLSSELLTAVLPGNEMSGLKIFVN